MTLLSKVLEVLCIIIGFGTIMGSLPDHWNILLGLPCFGLALSICVFIHELGHAAGAKACGWKTVVFAVGRFAIQLPNRSFGIVRREDREEVAGWVFAVPLKRDLATARRFIVFTAAGPIANLIFLVLLILIASVIPRTGSDFQQLEPAGLLFALAWLSAGMFFANAIPRRADNWGNDGAKIVDRFRQGDRSTGIAPFQWMLELLGVTVRLRDLPDWMVADALERTDMLDSDSRIMATILIGRSLDVPSPDRAAVRRLIDNYHHAYPPDHWSVACEAVLAAVYESDLSRAKEALARVSGPTSIPQLTLAAQAAIAMREGRAKDARRGLKEMDRHVRKASLFADLTYRDLRKTVMSLEPIADVVPLHN